MVYGDGACSGNPGPGGWAFLLADLDHGTVVEKSGFAMPTTNNRMELAALLETLKWLESHYPTEKDIELFWDSSYVVNGFNQWLFGWSKRDFTKADGKEISNLDLWKSIWDLKQKLPKFKMTQIPGHSALHGNERVDELAVAQSQRAPIEEYNGSLSTYPISVEDLMAPAAFPKGSEKKSNQKYPAYLSFVDGKLERDLDWPTCQARVKGKSAKYKKVKNSVEEAQTLKAWAVC